MTTRRGFFATIAALFGARHLPAVPAAKPRVPQFYCPKFQFGFTGYKRLALEANKADFLLGQSVYWHGQPPFVVIPELKSAPWEKRA